MKQSRIYILAFSALLAIFLNACNTPAERRGYSSIPQNYPASWENGNKGGGI